MRSDTPILDAVLADAESELPPPPDYVIEAAAARTYVDAKVKECRTPIQIRGPADKPRGKAGR